MWSLGCILYEILDAKLERKELAEECKDKKYRNVLFRGNFCFPLSPNPTNQAGGKLANQD